MEVILCLVFFLQVGLIFAAVPTFSGIPTALSVLENTQLETNLATITVTDPDGGTITACSHTGDSGEFDLRQDTGDTTLFRLYLLGSAGLNYDVTPSYILVVQCTDSGGEIGTDNIPIDVTPNQPPTLAVPSGTFSVSENEKAQLLIYTVTVSDPEGDTISCAITTSPTSTAFGMWTDAAGDYVLYLNNNPNLSPYNVVNSYDITITCSDDFGSSYQTLTVDVTPNQPPIFANTPYNATIDAQTTIISNSIFTVTASDTDSTTLTFSMTASPASPVFFQIDSVTGEITATNDLIYTVENAYELSVTVSDSKDTTTESVSVTLNNVNTAPIITNLPDTVNVAEDTTSGTVIFTVATSDPDTGDQENVTYTVSPNGFHSKFSYNDSTRQFSLSDTETLDYETLRTYNVHFTVSDNKAETGTYTLTVSVTDVNEPCNFTSEDYHGTTYEANSGYGSTDPGFVVTDDDDGSTYSLALLTTAESSYFSMDSSTGQVTFAVNYDVDSTHPSNVTLTVQCTDDYGATATTTLSMTILDVNDNTPEFGDTGYIYYTDQYDKPGQTVATISATDIDSGDNGDVEYTWTTYGAGSQKYELNSNGNVLLRVNPATMTYGETYEFLVTARDQGSPRLSSTTTVHMVYREVTTTTVTTSTTAGTVAYDFWDEPANVVMVAIACILALVALALLAFLLWKYCSHTVNPCTARGNCWEPKPKSRKVKPKPAPKKTPFDFWNENEFMRRKGQPREIRPDTMPVPAPVE